MAPLSWVKNVGTAGSVSTTATTLSVSVPAGGVAAGRLLVVRFAAYGYGTGVVSVADSRGNTYQLDLSHNGSSLGINAMFSCRTTTALLAGDLITVTHPADQEHYALAVDEFSGAHPTAWMWQAGPPSTGVSASPSFTVTPAAEPPSSLMVVGLLSGTALSTDVYTEDADTAGGDSWHTLTASFAPAGSTNASVQGAYKIPTDTTAAQQWSPVLSTSRFWAGGLVLYRGENEDVKVVDRPAGTRTGAPDARVLNGAPVTVTGDRPAGTRTGRPSAAIGNTVTGDRPAGTRTGRPSAEIAGGGATPLPVSTLTNTLPNPARPVVLFEADFTAGPPGVPGPNRVSLNAPVRRNVVRQWVTQRGRQYELDQVSAGTCMLDITDPLEYLHPLNAGSPFMTGGRKIQSYRRMRVVALWPTGGNMINAAAGCDPNFSSGTGRWQSLNGAGRLWSTLHWFQAPRSLRVTQTAPGAESGVVDRFDTAPGLTMTFSTYVWADPGVTVYAQVTDAAGAVHTSSPATGERWTRIYVTWQCVDTLEPVVIYGVGTAAPRFWVDCTQLEMALNPSPYSDTGPVPYDIYTGYIERFPIQYDHHGTRGIRPLTAVDALGILSRTTVSQSYDAVVLGDNPSIYLPLSNDAPPVSSTDLGIGTTARPEYRISSRGSINWASDSHPDGTPAPVFTQQNATDPPGRGWDPEQWTIMDLVDGPFTLDHTAGATIEFWARPVAGFVEIGGVGVFQPGDSTVLPGTFGRPLRPYANVHSNGGNLLFFYNPTGEITANYSLNGLYGADVYGPWRHFALGWDGGAWSVYLDGEFVDTSTPATQPSAPTLGMTVLAHVAVATSEGHPQAQVSFGRWAFYPRRLFSSDLWPHYQRGVGYVGESSSGRVQRLLDAYWDGPTLVATGGRLRMAADHDYHGRMLLEVLQEIQESERGLLYANRSGVVVFETRESRYQTQSSQWTFGEDVDAGELPYVDFAADYDPTFTFSQVNLSRPGKDAFPPLINAAAQADFGQRILSHAMQADSDDQVTEAGRFYLHRYSQQRVRVERMVLDPAANPALWPAILSLEISTRVTVKRRTGGLVTSADYYVEQINHTTDPDIGRWTVELQLSPVFVPSAWVLGDPTHGVLGSSTTPIY
ncbi:hypothetical protein [Saccharothrix hoggarensis]|uniref:Concanavalin A-like lectin/glucanase superfamily protein n=1 Tax=Saccharothrix hoggarensis TaxID=913853 RepID=A0ABW3QDX5_9PSEU